MTDLQPGQRLVFIDIETTGLFPFKDIPLEVGFQIVDLNLELIDRMDWLIWDTPMWDQIAAKHKQNDSFVWKMHTKSGLWEAAQTNGISIDDVKIEIFEWLQGQGISR